MKVSEGHHIHLVHEGGRKLGESGLGRVFAFFLWDIVGV